MGILADVEKAKQVADAWRSLGETLVFTNGVFDLIHVGHLRYLRAAKALGDRLIVGVNGDDSVSKLKGPLRPILPAAERAEILSSLTPVDLVVVFEEITASSLIEALCPHIYVKGADWAEKHLPEAEAVERCGGEIRFVPLVAGRSTTDVISTIVERFCGIEHGH